MNRTNKKQSRKLLVKKEVAKILNYPEKICSVVFRNKNQKIPELNQSILDSNRALCEKNKIPFELTEIIVDDTETRFAQLSNYWRFEKLSKEKNVLYIDWDIKLLVIPKLSKFAGCGRKGPYRDTDFFWSGETGCSAIPEYIEFAKKKISQYRACIAFQGFKTIETDGVIINYCTGLGRNGLIF